MALKYNIYVAKLSYLSKTLFLENTLPVLISNVSQMITVV